MPRFVIILCLLPLSAAAQKEASASRLARENILEYVSSKIFRSGFDLANGPLQSSGEKDSKIAWTMTCRLEVPASREQSDSSTKRTVQVYDFQFFLDHRLRVLQASSTSVSDPGKELP
ncbi:MAG TPA: hypothetical protein VFR58_17295 [Flavisolibacter sp.]|nr:hypothetical protein [Flavisolibacter sp.]